MKHLIQFIENQKLTIHKFEKSLGIRGTIDKAIKSNSNVGSNILLKIIETYPHLNSDWLLTGKGEMLRKNYIIEEKNSSLIAEENIYERNNIVELLKEQIVLLSENVKLQKEQADFYKEKFEICEAEKKPTNAVK